MKYCAQSSCQSYPLCHELHFLIIILIFVIVNANARMSLQLSNCSLTCPGSPLDESIGEVMILLTLNNNDLIPRSGGQPVLPAPWGFLQTKPCSPDCHASGDSKKYSLDAMLTNHHHSASTGPDCFKTCFCE